MITQLRSGRYRLIETKHHNKVLYLDAEAYAWVEPIYIGEILVVSHRPHKTDYVLSRGQYRLYDVKKEAGLADSIHLELAVGDGSWQGYLLLTGLPTNAKKRGRIVPTRELITPPSESAIDNLKTATYAVG